MSRTRQRIVLGGRNAHFCVGNYDFFLGFLFFYVFSVNAVDDFGYREVLFLVAVVRLLSMICLLFHFVLICSTSTIPLNLEHVVPLYHFPAQTLAGCDCPPLVPHHYTLDWRPETFRLLFVFYPLATSTCEVLLNLVLCLLLRVPRL